MDISESSVLALNRFDQEDVRVQTNFTCKHGVENTDLCACRKLTREADDMGVE